MRKPKPIWTAAAALTVALGYCLCQAAMAQTQPKARPKQPAKKAAKPGDDLLEIPKVSKDKLICFALYTVNNNILKLTAQLYPLETDDPTTAALEVQQDGRWRQVATAAGDHAGLDRAVSRRAVGHDPGGALSRDAGRVGLRGIDPPQSDRQERDRRGRLHRQFDLPRPRRRHPEDRHHRRTSSGCGPTCCSSPATRSTTTTGTTPTGSSSAATSARSSARRPRSPFPTTMTSAIRTSGAPRGSNRWWPRAMTAATSSRSSTCRRSSGADEPPARSLRPHADPARHRRLLHGLERGRHQLRDHRRPQVQVGSRGARAETGAAARPRDRSRTTTRRTSTCRGPSCWAIGN